MNHITLDMPLVAECAATECAFNVKNNCHAKAITIGNGVHPGCDTFFACATHTHDAKRVAGVGACKVSACKHNEDFECTADRISVGHSGGEFVCLTYAQ